MTPARKLSRRAALGLLAGLASLACTRNDGPIEPVWGKEPCAHCKMLVSDKRYAAQVSVAGERHYFDDIGCMVLWLETRDRSASRAWVRDAAGSGWLDAAAARYADGARTPMDFGFEARTTAGIDFEAMRASVTAKKRSSR